MKNRVLLLAAAGALGAGALPPMGAFSTPSPIVITPNAPVAQGSMQAPQGGIGTILGDLLRVGAGSHARRGPRRFKKCGWSVAHGKRMASKRRNVLRSKGHFRQAVR